MKYDIQIAVRDGENGNAPEQRISFALYSMAPMEAITEYARECAYRSAGCFGHVDPVVTWWVYRDGAVIQSGGV